MLKTLAVSSLDVLEKTWSATVQFQMIHSSGGMAAVAFAALPFYMTAIQPEMRPMWLCEVVDISPSGGFTSRLTRRKISTELNGTEIGCSQSQIDSTTCRPSSTSQNSSFTLFVQRCQGKA